MERQTGRMLRVPETQCWVISNLLAFKPANIFLCFLRDSVGGFLEWPGLAHEKAYLMCFKEMKTPLLG